MRKKNPLQRNLCKEYLARNPDVASAGLNPFLHYIVFGIRERRWFFRKPSDSKNAAARYISLGYKLFEESYRARNGLRGGASRWPVIFYWLFIGVFKGHKLFPNVSPAIQDGIVGLRFNARSNNQNLESQLPKFILEEISRQSDYEPSLLAAGNKSIANLPLIDADDLGARTGFDWLQFKGLKLELPKTMILAPHFVVGGADRYLSNLVELLNSMGLGPVQVLLTLPQAVFNKESRESLDMPGILKSDVVIWADLATHGQSSVDLAARYIRANAPENLFILNSELGYKTIAKYGRVLSQTMKIHSAFFSMDTKDFAGQYGVRHIRRIGKFSTAFSDNAVALEKLKYRYPFGEYFLLPSIQHQADEKSFLSKIDMGGQRHSKPVWLWISRLDSYKGTHILGDIARLKPGDEFHVYGPMGHESLKMLGLDQKNISYKGMLDSVANSDLSQYTGFLFTSRFEGMPLTLLEMSEKALPIISTDVGGIFKTFSEKSIYRVSLGESDNETARAFLRAMSNVLSESEENLKERLIALRREVTEMHSIEAVKNIAKKYFK